MKEFEENKKDQNAELEDLLMSNIEEEISEKERNKKTILIISAVVVLFVVVILVVYAFQQNSKKDVTTNTPLERGLEKAESPIDLQNKEKSEFGQIPIQPNASDEQIQNIISQIKTEQEKQQSSSAPAQTAKEVKTSKADQNLSNQEIPKGFYVQVGSFAKVSPNKAILGVIVDSGFSYQMQKAGNVNRLLVGPFANKQEAQKNLPIIKDKINKDAFIKEVK